MDRLLTMMALVLLCLAGCGEPTPPAPSDPPLKELTYAELEEYLESTPPTPLFTVHAVGADGARVRLATGITSETLATLVETVATEETTLEVKPLSMGELDIVFGMRGRGVAAYSNQEPASAFRQQAAGSSGGAACVSAAGWQR